MRIALWLIALFGVAAASALFASGNASSISIFWPPHRIDLSLNLFLALLLVFFFIVHLALQAISSLLAIPGQAQSWRARHHERILHGSMLEALSHLVAGRFIRAKKAAELVISRETALQNSDEPWSQAPRLRVLAHLLAAESAQALQDKSSRDSHFEEALKQANLHDDKHSREGVLLRAVRWSLEERDPKAALNWLEQLPSGVARRTVALRLRLKVARLARRTDLALETARLLAKHRAFSETSAQGLVRALVLESVHGARDADQLLALWQTLEPAERALPEVACASADCLLRMQGHATTAFAWLLPIWERFVQQPGCLSPEQSLALIQVLEYGFSSAPDAIDEHWLVRIEHAQQAQPASAPLQYLAAVACLQLQLWGKALQLLKQAQPRLNNPALQRRCWLMQAEMAQRQGDTTTAAQAWQNAARFT